MADHQSELSDVEQQWLERNLREIQADALMHAGVSEVTEADRRFALLRQLAETLGMDDSE